LPFCQAIGGTSLDAQASGDQARPEQAVIAGASDEPPAVGAVDASIGPCQSVIGISLSTPKQDIGEAPARVRAMTVAELQLKTGQREKRTRSAVRGFELQFGLVKRVFLRRTAKTLPSNGVVII